MISWKKELQEVFKKTGDDYDSMITTLTYEQLAKEFDDGYGMAEGKPFTAWGKKYVYFPVVYDGAEWVGYAPRNPCAIATDHWGGE